MLLGLGAAELATTHDYLQGTKQRTRSINALRYISTQVDVVIGPAFNTFQPEVTMDMERYGHCDVAGLMNLTGAPAITLPVAYTEDNLPISIHLFAEWWREDIIFKVGFGIEKCVIKREPGVYFVSV